MSLVWVNGRLVDKADARVSPFDHGFLYGDGVWEPLRVFNGELFRPTGHVTHLFTAAAVMGIDIPLSRVELVAAIESAVKANDRTEGYVRVIVTRGPGTIGPDPRKIDPQVFIIAEEYHPFPVELYDHGLHVVTAPVPLAPSNPAEYVRTLGRPLLALAKVYALGQGCLEAILLSADGFACAATEGNLFAVRDGTVLGLPSWPGEVTRTVVMELAREAGIPTGTAEVRGTDLPSLDELFLAGTSCGVIGIVRIDGQDVGGGTEGPVTRAIRERYRVLTRGG
jgi:branched-chain amino acid aminotransferase